MLKNTLMLVLTGIFFLGCKSHKETAKIESPKAVAPKVETPTLTVATATAIPEEAPKEAVEKMDTTKGELYRFSVVFFSIGSGTDNSAMKSFETFIGDFAGKVGKNIDYEKIPWGREGETDYCLRLKELTKEEQTKFIDQTTETLKGAKWVHIYENQPCNHKRRP